MKKSIICMIISILMIVSLSVVSFAAYYGDVNDDNLITAADARTILRVAAKLDKLDDEKIYIADMNVDGKITASDARTVLRMSAKLENLQEVTTKTDETQATTELVTNMTTTTEIATEEPATEEPTTEEPTTEEPTTAEPTTEELTTEDPTTEEPTTEEPTIEEPTIEEPTTEEPTTEEPTTEEPTTEEPTTEEPTTEEPTTEEPTTKPEEPVTYPESINAFMAGKYYVEGTQADGKKIKLAVSGDNAEIAVMSGEAQLSLLKRNAKTYIKTVSSEGKKYYVKYTELMKELFGADFEALTARFDFATYSEKNEPVVKIDIYDDKACDIYSFENDGSTIDFYVVDSETVKIEKVNSQGEVSTCFIVDKMSQTIPSDMLKISGFTSTQISNIPYIVPEFLDDASVIEPEVKTYPKAIRVFLSGKYYMSGTLYADGTNHSFSYVYNEVDKAVSLDGIAYFNRRGLMNVRDENEKLFAQVTDAQLKEYGIDFNKVMNDNTFALEGKTECIAFEKSTFNELPCDIYTLCDEKGNIMKFTIVFERLARIAVLDNDMNEVKYVVTDEFDDDIPDSSLTFIGFKKADIAKILG